MFIKTNFLIDMTKVEDYKKANQQIYQYFIEKLIDLPYKTRLNITFAMG